MAIELRHLRIFRVLAEELHFGRAALRLHAAQPGISRALKEMEDELGTTLLDRSSRKVQLTRGGRAFLTYTQRTLTNFEAGLLAARTGVEDGIERLTLGLMLGASMPAVGRLVKAFHDANPLAQIAVVQVDERDLGTSLATGRIDAAIGWRETLPSGLSTLPVAEAPLRVLVPEGHALASRSAVAWPELSGLPMIRPSREHHPIVFERAARHMMDQGCVPNVTMDVATQADMFAMVAGGLGISLSPVPEPISYPGVVLVDPEPGMQLEYALTWTTMSPTISALARCLPKPLAVSPP